MPTWECFKELCNLRFGPTVRGTRLSELARLPFVSTVQDYSDRFNTVLCHARNLSAPQKAELCGRLTGEHQGRRRVAEAIGPLDGHVPGSGV
jgi:hypothetical protein